MARVSTRLLVVLLDEIDALARNTLIAVLRQLRSGYAQRPQRVQHSGGIVVLGQLLRAETDALYHQHTEATGQAFTPEALEQTWAYLDRSKAEEGHLVIFDRTVGKSWE